MMSSEVRRRMRFRPFLFGTFPNLQYDSWVTIGLSEAPNAVIGEANVSTVEEF